METLGDSLYFLALTGRRNFSFRSPFQGLIQATVLAANRPITMQINQERYAVGAQQSLSTQLQEGVSCQIKGSSSDDRILILLFPRDRVPDPLLRKILDKLRVSDGVYLFSDNTVHLALQHAFDLYIADWQHHQLKIESIFIDALATQIELIVQESTPSNTSPDEQFEKVCAAKKIIDLEISKNHTIADLARRVGTNEQYLKKHFKAVYNCTIMGYMNEKKMQTAKALIVSGTHRIANVAILVGYSHPTHFTHAFKKRFGVLPRTLKPTSS